MNTQSIAAQQCKLINEVFAELTGQFVTSIFFTGLERDVSQADTHTAEHIFKIRNFKVTTTLFLWPTARTITWDVKADEEGSFGIFNYITNGAFPMSCSWQLSTSSCKIDMLSAPLVPPFSQQVFGVLYLSLRDTMRVYADELLKK